MLGKNQIGYYKIVFGDRRLSISNSILAPPAAPALLNSGIHNSLLM